MKDIMKKYFNIEESIKLVIFNIVVMTLFAGSFITIAVMLAGEFGYGQLPGMGVALIVLVVCFFLANNMKKLTLAASILIVFGSYILFPIIYFKGGAIHSGMPIYFALGMTFVYMLLDGLWFWILLMLQICVYVACFVLSYSHPELVVPLGNERDIYVDILQSLIIVGTVIGVINKLQRNMYEKVNQRINEQNLELIESEKKAELANRAKSDFLSSMSHEIRTPINGIIGMNEMIRREVDDENIKGYADAIHSSANALLSIINEILDISKIESGKMNIINGKYNLSSLVVDCYYMVSERAKDKGLSLYVRCDESLPSWLIGDITRVRQIVVNLLTNAIKYTDEGNVTVIFSGERKDDVLTLKITVSDTGIGLKEEDIKNLYTKFGRFDMERNQNVEGTGLGLNIVKELVSLMGGEVTVNSEYGVGTIFSVIIPQGVADEAAVGKIDLSKGFTDVEEKKYKPTIIAPSARVLVVDDVEMNLLVFRNLIKATQIKVDTALSGKECLERIKKEKYNIIFMDHMMPDMNGIETFEAMKASFDHKNVDTPVIMLTANAIIGMEEEYKSMGFNGYISKPVDDGKLEEILREYIPTEETVRAVAVGDVVVDNPRQEENNKEYQVTIGEVANVNYEGLKEQGIDINKGIENCGGSIEFYAEIVDEFENEDKRGDLLKAYADKNWEEYEIAVHALKGLLRTIGAIAVGDVAETLQYAAEKKDVAVIDEKHEAFVQDMDKALELIKEAVK